MRTSIGCPRASVLWRSYLGWDLFMDAGSELKKHLVILSSYFKISDTNHGAQVKLSFLKGMTCCRGLARRPLLCILYRSSWKKQVTTDYLGTAVASFSLEVEHLEFFGP